MAIKMGTLSEISPVYPARNTHKKKTNSDPRIIGNVEFEAPAGFSHLEDVSPSLQVGPESSDPVVVSARALRDRVGSSSKGNGMGLAALRRRWT